MTSQAAGPQLRHLTAAFRNLKIRTQGAAALVERSRRLRIVLLVLLTIYAFGGGIAQLDKQDVTGDAKSYIALGYNLYRLGVVSWGLEAPPDGEFGVAPILKADGSTVYPSQSRAPGYLALLAAGLHLHPAGDDVTLECLLDQVEGCDGIRRDLKVANVLLLTLTALLAYFAATRLSGSAMAGLAAGFLVASSNSLIMMSDTLRPEVLSAFLLLAASTALLFAWQRPQPARCILAGILFGLLPLCQPIFLYALPVLIVVVATGLWRRRTVGAIAMISIAGLSVLGFALVTGPWLVRNQAYFGSLNLSAGGAIVLRTRAEYNKLLPSEILPAFVYWAGDGRAETASLIFETDAYRRLDRDNRADGYYRLGEGRGRALAEETGIKGLAHRVLLTAEAKDLILADPVKHVLMSGLFAWRGMFAERGLVIAPRPVKISGWINRLWINLAYWAGTAYCLIIALRRRDFRFVVFGALALWSWAAYAGVSHAIPRYSYPLIPVLVILACCGATFYLTRRSPAAGGAAGEANTAQTGPHPPSGSPPGRPEH